MKAHFLAVTLLALLPLGGPSTAVAQKTAARASGPSAVLFCVEGRDEEFLLDPVVVIKGGRFTAPPTDDASGGKDEKGGPLAKRFESTYFSEGKSYRLLFGGADAGKATASGRAENSCISLSAAATLETEVKITESVMGLATDSPSIGGAVTSRREATSEERAKIVAAAQAAFRTQRVKAALIRKMETTSVTALDLTGDGKVEIVGSFLVNRDAETPVASVFVVLESTGEGYAPPRVFSGNYNESNYTYDLLFVDAADLDGDGTSEVVLLSRGYESWEYVIVKRQKGGWRKVYSGGGGGC